jgi:hypothetical protein
MKGSAAGAIRKMAYRAGEIGVALSVRLRRMFLAQDHPAIEQLRQ